jgi:uncharacterized cupredoxin-like copper-binding protein
MKAKPITLLLLVAALFLTACGGSAAPEAPVSNAVTLDIAVNDIYFGATPDNATNPPTWTVPAGAEMTITLRNSGGLEHNFAIVKLGEEIPMTFIPEQHSGIILMETGIVEPGQTSTDTLTAPTTPGEYVVVCTVAGHYPSMQGRLKVTES